MSELIKVTKEIVDYLKEKNVFSNFLLFGSVISANFAAYLACFDINALLIIDATTAGKHIVGIIILYVMVSAAVSLALLYLPNYFSLTETFRRKSGVNINIGFMKFSDKTLKSIRAVLSNVVFKYALSIFIFSCLYVGIENTVFIIYVFTIYFITILLSDYWHKDKNESNGQNEPEENNQPSQKKAWYVDVFRSFITRTETIFNTIYTDFDRAFEKLKNGEYIKFLANKAGFILIFLSLALGVGRADFVQNNVHVQLNGIEKTYVLYMTTSAGVALFDKNNKQVSFTSWDKINNMLFLKDKRRFIGIP